MNSVLKQPTLHWTRGGSGPPLVLVHGMGTTSADFSEVARRLAREFEVLAVDLPGFGASPPLDVRPTVPALADAVARDLDAMGLPRVHLLGNSLGARVALEIAKQERALSVVAIAPSGLNFPAERVYQAASLGLSRVLLRGLLPVAPLLTRTWAGRAALLANLRAMPWRASKAEAQALLGGAAESRKYWQVLLWSIVLDVPSGLEAIECPILLAQGTADWIAGGQTPRFLAALPSARFTPLPAAGHAPMSDAPDAIVRLAREAVRRSRKQPESLPVSA